MCMCLCVPFACVSACVTVNVVLRRYPQVSRHPHLPLQTSWPVSFSHF